jgi:acyl carrier protein
MMDIAGRTIQIVIDLVDDPDVSLDTDLVEDLGLDSIEQDLLLDWVEGEFNISITSKEASKWHTVRDITDTVAQKS